MLLSVVGVIAAEYSNRRVYPIVMSIYAAGINIGAVLGAVLVGPLLPEHGWRYGFWIGVVFSVIAIVIATVAFPESISWLAARRKPGSLDRLNRTLGRMGHAPLPLLPDDQLPARDRRGALRTVFSSKLVAQTLLLVLGNIALLVSFYFANSWAPNTLAETTRNPAIAAPTTLALGLGGILGTVVFGFISTRVSPRVLTPIFLIVGAVGIAIFGSIEAQVGGALTEIFAASFFFSSGVAGFYQIAPRLYPTLARATGYGIVTGAGRLGGIAAPILAGAALDAHISVPVVFVIFALPLVVSALCLVVLVAVESVQRRHDGSAVAADDGSLASLAN
jgi:MFS family permease